jgi:hypothetical protein
VGLALEVTEDTEDSDHHGVTGTRRNRHLPTPVARFARIGRARPTIATHRLHTACDCGFALSLAAYRAAAPAWALLHRSRLFSPRLRGSAVRDFVFFVCFVFFVVSPLIKDLPISNFQGMRPIWSWELEIGR